MNFTDNEEALNTIKFVNATNRAIFLTGKAGTGKTTLLHNIVSHTHKEYIIAAPTGIAALNAGGVTIHSLFQLPFGAFVPDTTQFTQSNTLNFQLTPLSYLPKKIKLNSAKRNLLKQAELLIIDEVSMLRADLLDAIDFVLRYVRRKRSLPFGGLQVLFIGDMLQLPPIVKDNEWAVLKNYYKSMYFFDAHVFQQQKPIVIELERIYRQTDKDFVSILNNLRNNIVLDSDIEILNKFVQPDFKPREEDSYIHITTHNNKANTINSRELAQLPSESFYYEAIVRGDFSEHLYPLEYKTEFKEGAQIMFVKNDYSGESLYYNGKIGVIHSLSNDEILVRFPETNTIVSVERYMWEHKRFELNKSTGAIEEKELGTFTHYPIKLAWAVTVHKSQGLTFKQAIIDVSDAFAPGQIYVALSRLESLDGLVLTQAIHTNIPEQNRRLLQFANRKLSNDELNSEYQNGVQNYVQSFIMEAFDISAVKYEMNHHLSTYTKDTGRSNKQAYKKAVEQISVKIPPVATVAMQFQTQVQRMFMQENDLSFVLERVTAAVNYFEPLFDEISNSFFLIIDDLQSQRGVKAFENELRSLELLCFNQFQKMRKCILIIEAVLSNQDVQKKDMLPEYIQEKRKKLKPTKSKAKKSTKSSSKIKDGRSTQEISYEMFESGMSIEQISIERSLKPSTIAGHLCYFVAEGMIDVVDIIPEDVVSTIKKCISSQKTYSLKAIKEHVPHDYTYQDIKLTLAHMEASGGISL
ncbi:MAG: helix-turn-helix domain-containing protein [Bacteroidales bacterium]|jgi:energy-coupling factor transporter ATP-binding protein EcfA2|nr:helix-turn-helix domain-containing protein [Bacteroidales bacterium]